MTEQVKITESAARRIAELKSAEGNEQLMLRIAVSGGGCSGFQYGFPSIQPIKMTTCCSSAMASRS